MKWEKRSCGKFDTLLDIDYRLLYSTTVLGCDLRLCHHAKYVRHQMWCTLQAIHTQAHTEHSSFFSLLVVCRHCSLVTLGSKIKMTHIHACHGQILARQRVCLVHSTFSVVWWFGCGGCHWPHTNMKNRLFYFVDLLVFVVWRLSKRIMCAFLFFDSISKLLKLFSVHIQLPSLLMPTMPNIGDEM